MKKAAGFLFMWIVLSAGGALAAPLKIITSFSILGDLTRQIGGDHVLVTDLVGPDSDAHVFQPSPKDVRLVAEADLVIINGLGFEGWIERLIRNAQYQRALVTASDGLTKPIVLMENDHEHGHNHHEDAHESAQPESDPHAWQDLTNGRLYVQNIARALKAADPAQAQLYQANADRLDRELTELDHWVRQQIETVPAAKRRVITAHDAFGYFAAAYGVNFEAPVGLDSEDEPGAKELKQLIAQIRAEKIRALFLENMSNPATINQLATETGAVVGPSLYADALSAKDGTAATYQAMFRHNVAALVAGMARN